MRKGQLEHVVMRNSISQAAVPGLIHAACSLAADSVMCDFTVV
jgi:hypothetical protein